MGDVIRFERPRRRTLWTDPFRDELRRRQYEIRWKRPYPRLVRQEHPDD